jgi:hypothetical protein
MPNKYIRSPKSKTGRLLLGWALIVGGIFGFLPVLGFWMIPLGVIILSADSPFMRRLRRRAEVWIGRKRGRKKTASKKSGKQETS